MMSDDPKPDEIVYHYCSLDTFVKIVTGKKLWLSNVFCMNDYEEHRWFRRLVRTVEKEMVNAGEVSQDELRKGLIRGDSILDIEDERFSDGLNTWKQVYCVSFSKTGDSLSQWRAYGDGGQGVAIGFRREYLEEITQKWSPGDTQVVDVLYDDQSQREAARQVVLIAANKWDLLGEDAEKVEPKIGCFWAAVALFRESASHKSPAFAHEEEVRLVYCHSKFMERSPQYRAKGGMLIPYFEIPISPERQPIREVVCGPTNYFLQNQRFIGDLLQENDYGAGIEVTQSKASYRTA
jgi:hypothetical protein